MDIWFKGQFKFMVIIFMVIEYFINDWSHYLHYSEHVHIFVSFSNIMLQASTAAATLLLQNKTNKIYSLYWKPWKESHWRFDTLGNMRIHFFAKS